MCVRLYVDTSSAGFVTLPLKTQHGQTAKWGSDNWPGLAVAAAHSGQGETGQMSRQDLRYRSAHWLTPQNAYSMGRRRQANMVY